MGKGRKNKLLERIKKNRPLNEVVAYVPELEMEVLFTASPALLRLESASMNQVRAGWGGWHADPKELNPKTIERCVLDPDTRKPLFTAEDIIAEGETLNGEVLNGWIEVINLLTAGTDKQIEEWKKRFSIGRNGEQFSSSPSCSSGQLKNSSQASAGLSQNGRSQDGSHGASTKSEAGSEQNGSKALREDEEKDGAHQEQGENS